MDASALRSEIVESQKFKVDLMKWKLLLAAGLGAAALGLEKDHGMPILLGLVPLVCAYVDVICYHTDLRMLVIARFCRDELPQADLARAYEVSCLNSRQVFKLENFALFWATFTLSAVVVLVAVVPQLVGPEPSNPGALSWANWRVSHVPVAAAGAFGLIASALIRSYFRDSADALDGHAEAPGPWQPSGRWVIVAGVASMVIGAVLIGEPGRAASAGRTGSILLEQLAIATGVLTFVAGVVCAGVGVQGTVSRRPGAEPGTTVGGP